MIFEIEHVDISAEHHFPKAIRMKIELIIDKFLKMLRERKDSKKIAISAFSYSIDFVTFLQCFAILLQASISSSRFQFEPHALHFTKIITRRRIFLQSISLHSNQKRRTFRHLLEWIFRPCPKRLESDWHGEDTSCICNWQIDRPCPSIALRPSTALPFENHRRAIRSKWNSNDGDRSAITLKIFALNMYSSTNVGVSRIASSMKAKAFAEFPK